MTWSREARAWDEITPAEEGDEESPLVQVRVRVDGHRYHYGFGNRWQPQRAERRLFLNYHWLYLAGQTIKPPIERRTLDLERRAYIVLSERETPEPASGLHFQMPLGIDYYECRAAIILDGAQDCSLKPGTVAR